MKRFPFLPLLLFAIAAVPLIQAPATAQPEQMLEPVSVFLVRHAETASSTRTNRNPELSERGSARGNDLAKLLRAAGVTHLFASEYSRTQGTLSSLAKSHGLEVKVVSAGDSATQLEMLRSLPAGSVAVVCGHSNTVPAMVAGLGGSIADLKDLPAQKQVLDHDEYGRLFLVTLPTSRTVAAKTVELRYGEAKVAHQETESK